MVSPAQRNLAANPTIWTPWEPVTGFEDLQFHVYERRERVRGGGVALPCMAL